MKTIGLIGGMSWESSQEYYRIINETVKERLGGLHSAKIVMYSVDFDEFEKLLQVRNWDKITELMIDAIKRIEKGGAEFVVICTNTMHKTADDIQNKINRPDLISIKGIDVLAGMVVINNDMNLTKEQSYNPDQIEIINIPGMGVARVRWIVSGNNDYTINVDSEKGGKVEWTSGS